MFPHILQEKTSQPSLELHQEAGTAYRGPAISCSSILQEKMYRFHAFISHFYSNINPSWPVQFWLHVAGFIIIRYEEFESSEVLPHIKYRSALLNRTGQKLPTNSRDLVFTNPEDKVMSMAYINYTSIIIIQINKMFWFC